MKNLHYKQEMRYLNAIVNHLVELGFHVEKPDTKYRDILDVWGKMNGRKCFVEITVQMWAHESNINGVLMYGENDPIEMYLDKEYGLDTRNSIECILEGLEPFKKGKIK